MAFPISASGADGTDGLSDLSGLSCLLLTKFALSMEIRAGKEVNGQEDEHFEKRVKSGVKNSEF